MKAVFLLMLCGVLFFAVSVTFCHDTDPNNERLVHASFTDKEVLKGPLKLNIKSHHAVGIVCKYEVFHKLLECSKKMEHGKELQPEIEKPVPEGCVLVTTGYMGQSGSLGDHIKDFHYLFGVSGRGNATLILKIPEAIQKDAFRIVLVKNSAQLVLPFQEFLSP